MVMIYHVRMMKYCGALQAQADYYSDRVMRSNETQKLGKRVSGEI